VVQSRRQLSARSVLLVEDDLLLRESLRRMLEAEGHRVVHACDGRRAGAAIRLETFDLLVIDVLFAGGQTIDALVERNRTSGRLRILGLCRFARILPDYYLNLTAKLGVRVILAKPFDRAQLAEAVAEACAGEGEPAQLGRSSAAAVA
jgi:two-component system chemotaxis response regulator CheY